MKFVSIKWKIVVALIGLGVVLVGSYVLLAKKTFEEDKISYIYESQQSQANLISKSISQQIQRSLFNARSFLAVAKTEKWVKNSVTIDLLSADDFLYAVQGLKPTSNEQVFSYRKPGLPATVVFGAIDRNPPGLVLKHLFENYWQLDLPVKDSGQPLAVAIILRLNLEFDVLRNDQNLMIMSDTGLVLSRQKFAPDLEKQIVNAGKATRLANTSRISSGGENYLVSLSSLDFRPYKIALASNEASALGALDILFKRSMFFVFFSICFIFLISIGISRGLTRNLRKLTEESEQIGLGYFEPGPVLESSDEIGQLSRVFQQMKVKIKGLLEDTKDKTRMEQELQTAKLVQESLFPREHEKHVEALSIWGQFEMYSECGGDWWYYFRQGEWLYVAIADATGHGTPAALVTAATRSIFSMLEHSNLTVTQMMQAWHNAVSSCSNERVFMTAFLIKINGRTGQYSFINASHEPPALLRRENGIFTMNVLAAERNHRLGDQGAQEWIEQSGTLNAGERLVLYTDGLVGMENEEGKTMGEKRLWKKIAQAADETPNVRQMGPEVMKVFNEFRGTRPINDDVTLVIVERTL
ncbi:MAG: SpoIIE family protein phosphatase [Bdellovibrionaceae bacterium]|nr:SpoIIE family protein phosphatase [Pseudobdellovibrionaceae bacterium]